MINSLGINKDPKNTKVVVAMSGGVDSSVVAGIMKEEKYNVIGVTLKLYDDAKSSTQSRQCCAGQDILDAKRVSEKLNIKHEILYYQKKFKAELIDSFIVSYNSGETPIPCVQCNQTVKFRDLFKYKRSWSRCAYHWSLCSSKTEWKKASMYMAKDGNRDQSYFLFNTTQNQLDFIRFLLEKLIKLKQEKIASRLDLNVANKPDSQDICFVPNGDYGSVIQKFRPDSFKAGDIIDLNGKKIGTHDGIVNFTIGQRRGIKIASSEPLYVLKINSKENSIVVGSKKSLLISKIDLRELNIFGDESEFKNEINVKVRSTGKLLRARIQILDDKAEVNMIDEETGISPGQACVFYSKDNFGDKLLGGGWIDKTYNKNLST